MTSKRRRRHPNWQARFGFSPRNVDGGVSGHHDNAPKGGNDALERRRCRHRQNRARLSSGDPQTPPPRNSREDHPCQPTSTTTDEEDDADAHGGMPRRPRGQRQMHTTTLFPEPLLRHPRAAGRRHANLPPFTRRRPANQKRRRRTAVRTP